VQPWQEQLLLAVGVPLHELHILAAAAAAVQAKQPDSYPRIVSPFQALLQSASWTTHLGVAAKVANLQAARTADEAQHSSSNIGSSSSSSSSSTSAELPLCCVPEQYLYPVSITALEVLLLMCNPKIKRIAAAPACAALSFTQQAFGFLAACDSSTAESVLGAVLQSVLAVMYLIRKTDQPAAAAADNITLHYITTLLKNMMIQRCRAGQ
jgi:hypothetical protein